MTITLNGEAKEIPEGLSIRALLEHLGIHPGRVAVERNLEILPRRSWETTRVEPGDLIEIVHFVGGG